MGLNFFFSRLFLSFLGLFSGQVWAHGLKKNGPLVIMDNAKVVATFHQEQHTKLEAFAKEHPALLQGQHVFYPFGGSDILYPLALFPKAQRIILVGLEHIHFLKNMDLGHSFAENPLSQDVVSLLIRSFSVSQDMWNHDKNPQDGVCKRIYDQLRILGVTEASMVHHEDKHSLKVSFVYQGLPREIIYRKISLMNSGRLQNFLAWCRKKKVDTVLLKATSYCAHQKNFSQLRLFLQTHGQLIVQDDTGIPLHLLEKTHDVDTYGFYHKPYGEEWKAYTQPLLQKKASQNSQNLGFYFGYGARRQPAIILVAQKKPSPTTAPGKTPPNKTTPGEQAPTPPATPTP